MSKTIGIRSTPNTGSASSTATVCRAPPVEMRSPTSLPTSRSDGPPVSSTRDVAIGPALVSTPTTPYGSLIVPFVLAGVGMALFFTPMANLVLSTVRRDREGQASGANNAIRELGGVFGVAVLATVFSRFGGYGSGQTFVDGMTPALWIGAIAVGLGAVAAFAIPAKRREPAMGSEAQALEPAPGRA